MIRSARVLRRPSELPARNPRSRCGHEARRCCGSDMPRHLTLADIGHGVSRHRERRRSRWLLVLLILALLAGGGLLVPRLVSTPSAGVAASACPNGTTQLVVATSTDKSNLMSTFGAQFSASGKDAHGRCVHVVTVAKSSGAGMTALVAGWPGTGPK